MRTTSTKWAALGFAAFAGLMILAPAWGYCMPGHETTKAAVQGMILAFFGFGIGTAASTAFGLCLEKAGKTAGDEEAAKQGRG